MTTSKSVKICCIPGCNEPRMPKGNSGYHPRCTAHMREYWKQVNHGGVDRSRNKICSIDGCNEPRATTESGFAYPYCAAHQKEYTAEQNRKAREKKRSTKPMTEAQKHVGFDRNPQQASKALENFKVCIIDYDADTMTFIEGKVTRRCQTDALKLLPGGWQILLDGHAEEGYTIVQRGTPPNIPGIDSHYGWRD